MNVLQFVFHCGWHFFGVILLLYVIAECSAYVAKACRGQKA